MIDPEAESAAITERSAELAQLLDESTPTVDRSPLRAVQAEANRLAGAARVARADVAARIAAGLDPGVTVGRMPAIRRIHSTPNGRDPNAVLRGRSVITPQLVAYWTHQRDTVAPATEDVYRRAIALSPPRAALLAAARAHLAVLGSRHSTDPEGAEELHAALRSYEGSYTAMRDAIVDAQHVATIAADRLASLERVRAEAVLGDDGTATAAGLIAAAQVMLAPGQLVDAKSGRPIEAAVQ